MSVADELVFWFEFASTYSYPAATQVARAVTAGAARVHYRPFLLGPIFGAQGWNDSPFNIYPAKGRYMWQDLARLCAREGLSLQTPSVFPRNGLRGARLCTALADAPELPALVCAIYELNFANDAEISEPEVLAQALAKVGLPAQPWLQCAGADDTKALLRAHTEQAVSMGIFGSPTFSVGDTLFWGGDRLQDALALAAVPCELKGITLRPLRAAESAAALQLWRASILEVPSSQLEQDLEAKLRREPALMLAALHGERLVGTCMAGFEGRRGWLNVLCVAEDVRGQGIGAALVRAAEARLSALGCTKVNLQVRSQHAQVMGFYEHLGYQGQDLHSMGKRLATT